MYNLIVTAQDGAWERNRYSIPLSRFGEHTPESLKARYRSLDSGTLGELTAIPALFAYEDPVERSAKIGRVTRIRHGSQDEIRFEFEFSSKVPPIPPERLRELSWELDIGRLELNRTHWAIKDIDLVQVLRDEGFVTSVAAMPSFATEGRKPQETLSIAPTVFSIPEMEREEDLVAVMMPFRDRFDRVYETIRIASQRVGLRSERADDIWDESTIIQDVFNLIYRSRIVVSDLSERNANVMYETGIAHTLGRPVVPISQPTEGLPFDLAHHRTLLYHPNNQGLDEMQEKLEAKLRSLIRSTR